LDENNVLAADIQQEIEDELYFYVRSGFFPQADILGCAHQIFEDICMDNDVSLPSESHIRQTVERLADSAESSVTDRNNYVRLRNVFDALNRERIIAIHFAGYTQSDGHDEVGVVFQFMKDNNIPRRGYCFYHQQDIERAMDESIKRLYLAFHSMNGDEQIAVEVGKRIAELLTQNGFDVEWDNSPGTRIAVNNFLWDKVYDEEDYGIDRAIRIMREVM